MIALTAALVATMLVLGYLFNHGLARIAFVELALTNGHRSGAGGVTVNAGSGAVALQFSEDAAAVELGADVIALFASNSCATCVRLIDELGAPDVDLGDALHIYFSSTKPNIPVPGQWFDRQQALFDTLSIPATPYLVVMRDGAVAAHGPVANPARFQGLLQQGSHSSQLPTRLLGALPDASADRPAGVTP